MSDRRSCAAKPKIGAYRVMRRALEDVESVGAYTAENCESLAAYAREVLAAAPAEPKSDRDRYRAALEEIRDELGACDCDHGSFCLFCRATDALGLERAQ